MFCRSSCVLLAIVLSVLLRYMDSDYLFGIFKLFLIRPTWMEWLYKVRLMRNDMNCLLFQILLQRFFRLNRNSCFCVWDLLWLLVFLSSFFFGFVLYFAFIWFCLVGVALIDRFVLSCNWLVGFHALLTLSSHRFLYAILPQHYRILRCNAFE